MVPPIHLGAWSMALMLWLPFELLLLLLQQLTSIDECRVRCSMKDLDVKPCYAVYICLVPHNLDRKRLGKLADVCIYILARSVH